MPGRTKWDQADRRRARAVVPKPSATSNAANSAVPPSCPVSGNTGANVVGAGGTMFTRVVVGAGAVVVAATVVVVAAAVVVVSATVVVVSATVVVVSGGTNDTTTWIRVGTVVSMPNPVNETFSPGSNR